MTAKKKQSNYVLDTGVGVNFETHDRGWGLKETPHLAVLTHPIQNMTMWGPFINEDAAHKWVRESGTDELYRYFGEQLPGAQWHVVMIHVPTHEENQ